MEDHTFLGIGWGFPPQFVRETNSVAMTANAENVKENLKILFDTKVGERVMEYDYGTKLHALVFGSNGAELQADIKDTISHAILMHEPRVNLISVALDDSGLLHGVVYIKVTYEIISANTRYNLVYPFYLSEGTNLSVRPQPSE
ncbi:MAG: GPW/gp25 family protein [Bacteroidota bacterium]